MSQSEDYGDPGSKKYSTPDLPQANLFERLWQTTDKIVQENEERSHQQLLAAPKPNSSVRDSGYSTRRTIYQSTVYSQVGFMCTFFISHTISYQVIYIPFKIKVVSLK